MQGIKKAKSGESASFIDIIYNSVKSISSFLEGSLIEKQESLLFAEKAKSLLESISIPIITSNNLLPSTSTTERVGKTISLGSEIETS